MERIQMALDVQEQKVLERFKQVNTEYVSLEREIKEKQTASNACFTMIEQLRGMLDGLARAKNIVREARERQGAEAQQGVRPQA